MSTPTLLDAAKNAEVWLANCTPHIEATKENPLPLPLLRAAIAAHESASQNWALKAAEELLIKTNPSIKFGKKELAAIIQKHAPPSLERELAEALRKCRFAFNPLLTELREGNESLRLKILDIQNEARAILARYDERQK